MSNQLENMQAYGHRRLRQGGKAAIVIVVVVVAALLLCACAAVAALLLLGPAVGDLLSQFFVPA